MRSQGKGSARRPKAITEAEEDARWAATFSEKVARHVEWEVTPPFFSWSCACGNVNIGQSLRCDACHRYPRQLLRSIRQDQADATRDGLL